MGTSANSEDPDVSSIMLLSSVSTRFANIKLKFRDKIYHILKENYNCDPSEYTMGSSILVMICTVVKIHQNTKG